MTVEEKVQAILSTDKPLIGNVPADRIRVPGKYQDVERPWIVHFPAGGVEPFYTHEGLGALRIWPTYQVSIYSDNYESGRAVTELVIAALSGVHAGVHVFWAVGGFRHWQEPNTAVHHFILEFRIAEALSA